MDHAGRLALQITTRPRLLILRLGLGVLIAVVLAYPVFTFKGIPSALFYKRQERQFCIRCGRQDLEESRMSLDGTVHKSSKMLIQPKIDGIDAEHCDHWFLPIASKDGFFEVCKFRWIKGGTGSMDGDPLYEDPSLIRAFALMSKSDVGRGMDLFMMLMFQTDIRKELLSLIKDQKAGPERIINFLQEAKNDRDKNHILIPK